MTTDVRNSRTPSDAAVPGTRPGLIIVFDEGAVMPAEISTSLGKEFGLIFATADTPYTSRFAPLLRQLGRVVPLTGDVPHDAASLKEVHADGIVTFSEKMLRRTAELAERLGLPFHRVETARLLTDKFEQRQLLNAAGANPTRSSIISSAGEWEGALADVGLPAVVKPVRGAQARDTHLVRDAEDVRALRAELFERPTPVEAMVAEQYLRGRPSAPFGDFVSVETVCTQGRFEHVAVTGKFPLEVPFREQGQFWPSTLDPEEQKEIQGVVSSALAALGVEIGVTHTEVKLTENGPRIIEVNGRVGGHQQDLTRRAGNSDLVAANARIATGRPPGPSSPQHGKVVFQYIYLAPTTPCRMVSAVGLDQVRRLPGISQYVAFCHPGDTIAGGVGSSRIGHLRGEAPDHAAMLCLIDEALAMISYEFVDDHDQRFTLTRSLR